MRRLLSMVAWMALVTAGGCATEKSGRKDSTADAEPLALKNPAVTWESLPHIRTGVKVWSHTSKSPINCTVMDWTNYTLQEPGGYEEAHVQGASGMLVHAWFAFLGNPEGRLKLYLNAGGQPSVDMPFVDYFQPATRPTPLWFNFDGNIWTAFPCMAVDGGYKAELAGRRPDWYQHTLHLYREKRFSETLAPAEIQKLADAMLKPAGTFPGTERGNRTQTNTVHVTAQPVPIFEARQPGVLRSLRLVPSDTSAQTLDGVTLRITTDGEVTAELPLSMFFGGYRGVDMKNARGLPAGFDGQALYCYFPMPFWKAMRIELIGGPELAATALCEAHWSDSNPYPEESTGRFKVQYNDNTMVKAGEPDFVNLSVEGSGLLVGCVSRLTGDIEANFSIFTDDARTPVIESTGGEDYFNHAYGIHVGLCGPFSGGLAPNTAYRFHIVDYVPFLRSLNFTQDHARHFVNDRDGEFLSAVYYYHNPRTYLNLTDELDVGQPDAEAVHRYRSEGTAGRIRLQKDRSAYEGYYREPITDEGRWTDGSSSFTVRIDRHNDGVRLRRRINTMAYHQQAEVYVDGQYAGLWFEQGSNMILNYPMPHYRAEIEKYFAERNEPVPTWEDGTMPTQFRDTEFEIPVELTRGKSKLQIRLVAKGSRAVRPADEGLINEYHYWVYSYRPLNSK